MKLFPKGDRVFEVLSRYDDLLTLEERADYEPGDTLALILPFLILHRITDKEIVDLAIKATFVAGAEKLISRLQSRSFKVFCITTTYEPYAMHLTHKLEIFAQNLACTTLPFKKLQMNLVKDEFLLLRRTEETILALTPVTDDEKIKKTLDEFYWKTLPATSLGELMSEVKPMGGRRKLAALNRFAEKYAQPLSGWVVVGDSITDFRMLAAVNEAGGLAIAFNGNEYALPYATIGLAAKSIYPLAEVLEAWQKGQRKAVERLVKDREKAGSDEKGHLQWLAGRKDLDDIIQTHKRLRRMVRDEAAKLG
jgi:energy-converting hydrogenase A subunit R